jgi:hypothetical protein
VKKGVGGENEAYFVAVWKTERLRRSRSVGCAIEDQASMDGVLDSLIPYRNIVLGPAETDLEIVVLSNELQDCCSALVRLAHWSEVTTRGSTDNKL